MEVSPAPGASYDTHQSRRRAHPEAVAASALVALLAGCGASSSVIGQATATTQVPTAALATATPSPTATTAVVSQTSFACPAAVNGSLTVFSDAETGVTFSYQAAWTEHDCVRTVLADGSESLLIGNLFRVGVAPRKGLTIQQWVDQRTDKNEIVTLTPLTVKHADAAVTVTDAPAPNYTSSRPFDAEPFASTSAIIAGSQQFYQVSTLIAEVNVTDSTASSHDAFVQVIASFDVP
jgi:hypothetical protein